MKLETTLCIMVLVLFAWTRHCCGEKRRYGLYEFGRCPDEKSKFKTLINQPLRDCVKHCAIRPSCIMVGYNRNEKNCTLHTSGGKETNPRCIMVDRDTINITEFTGNCSCKEWEVCDVETGNCTAESKECYGSKDKCSSTSKADQLYHCLPNGTASQEYTGTVSTTIKGKTCQRWDQHYPHPHKYRSIDMFPDDSFKNASNYCRDPSKSGHVWCYTTDTEQKYDLCDVTRCLPEFSPSECYRFDEEAKDYKGTINTTANGYPCQSWNSQSPHKHLHTNATLYPDKTVSEAKNYCRDPDRKGVPWCFTTDESAWYETCDVARCLDPKFEICE